MDIPFLSSTWAPDSSDTHCTSSEQSILQSCTCYSAAECERLNLRAHARSGSALSSSSVGANSCSFRLKWKSVSGSLAHCEESLLRVVWLCTLHHLAALIIYLTSTFFFAWCQQTRQWNGRFYFERKVALLPVYTWNVFPSVIYFTAVDFGCQGAELHIEQRSCTLWLVWVVLALKCFRLSWAK